MTNRRDKLLSILQGLSEYELTIKVLLPLFKALGFERVEYSGGPLEEGKDIICWKRDEIGELELAVAQVKKHKPTRSNSGTRSFGTIINQLSQASVKALPNQETQLLYTPQIVYLVTPFPLDTTALLSRFETLSLVRPARIKIIDGSKLVNLLEAKLKSAVDRLLGYGQVLSIAMEGQLSNSILARALNATSGRDVESFYTEIDFSPGQMASQVLFHVDLESRPLVCKLDDSRWRHLLLLREFLLEEIGADILADSMLVIQSRRRELEQDRKPWEDKHSALINECTEARRQEAIAREKLQSTLETLRTEGCIAFKNYGTVEDVVKAVRMRRENKLAQIKREADPSLVARNRIEILRAELLTLEANLGNAAQVLEDVIEDFDLSSQALISSNIDLQQSLTKEPPLYFEACIDASGIISYLLGARRDLKEWIENLNSSASRSELSLFMTKYGEVLRILQRVLEFTELITALGLVGKDRLKQENSTRLTVGIQKVLDTGLNVFVLGEAGAGKTTCLQMYARRRLSVPGDRNCLVLYIPMARLIAYERGIDSARVTLGGTFDTLGAIQRFLAVLNVEISLDEIVEELDRGGVIILDGVDEFGGGLPSIVDALEGLADRFPKTQWILSARTSGRMEFVTRFVPVTLLPFSDLQRSDFARQWFGKSAMPRVEIGEAIIGHLSSNEEIGAVVRNPLLMTILCVLGEHGVPLPNTEIRLFKDRFDLLTGRYDLFKHIARMCTRQEYLLSLAQKVAFRLHGIRARDVELGNLFDWSMEILGTELGDLGSKRAVEELIDPCNVLVPMSLDGRVGFGHLRFQEYLAAKELIENRNVNVLPLLRDAWWQDGLLFFARLSSNLGWLVSAAMQKFEEDEMPPIVSKMISVGPVREREGLAWVLKNGKA